MLAGERLPNPKEHLGVRVPHQDEEAGSIKEVRVITSAAAKENEEFLDKDAEILRLIEERRSTPKEEKQRLKDLSKRIKMHQRKKRMKRQQDIQRILEEFKGVGIKQKSRTTRENASHLEKELPTSSENSTEDFTRTTREMTSNMT